VPGALEVLEVLEVLEILKALEVLGVKESVPEGQYDRSPPIHRWDDECSPPLPRPGGTFATSHQTGAWGS